MHKRLHLFACLLCLSLALAVAAFASEAAKAKPSAAEVLAWLKAGNARFDAGTQTNPNTDQQRVALSGRESQANHALATVLSCSDSRVPVERLFDAGVMDLFVVRVAGNVANTDEIGSIEYGLLHVNTPVLVVLGHTQCGAVTAVTQAIQGHGHALERNIPPLVASIGPAVQKTMAANPGLEEKALVAKAIETNIWEAVRNLLTQSPAVREAMRSGKVKIVGAVYDVGEGSVAWLPEETPAKILAEVDVDPAKATNAMAEDKPAAKPAAAAVGAATALVATDKVEKPADKKPEMKAEPQAAAPVTDPGVDAAMAKFQEGFKGLLQTLRTSGDSKAVELANKLDADTKALENRVAELSARQAKLEQQMGGGTKNLPLWLVIGILAVAVGYLLLLRNSSRRNDTSQQ